MPKKIEREHRKKQRLLANKKKRALVRSKNRAEKKKKTIREANLTQNARMICNILAENGIRGNYKDYVLVLGNNLVDWKRSYSININRNSPEKQGEILIVHKKNLRKILPAEMAAEFWHPTLGRTGAATR